MNSLAGLAGLRTRKWADMAYRLRGGMGDARGTSPRAGRRCGSAWRVIAQVVVVLGLAGVEVAGGLDVVGVAVGVGADGGDVGGGVQHETAQPQARVE